jgi:hypothetical protein
LNKIFSLFAILAMCVCFSAATAKADGGGSGDLLYTLTGGPSNDPITVTFDLPQTPTIGGSDNYDMGEGFQIDPINLTVNGTPVDNDCLFFYSLFGGGGLQDNNSTFNLMNPVGSTTMLYSGPESNPTMLPLSGPITLTDFDTGTETYTLTVSSVTAPEPTSLLLLASGIVGLCLMRKFRTA